ncbi:MAG: hypothetical protein KJ607_08465, partial [Bacteroidetes bacterium]|nr:hypothetical protein [Bacteroidota bacterium]
MITEDDIELIEKYLSGRLDEQASEALRQRLENDTELAEEYAFMTDVKASACSVGRRELKKKLQDISYEFHAEQEDATSQSTEEKSIRSAVLKIAAVVIILLGIPAVLYLTYIHKKDTVISEKSEFQILLDSCETKEQTYTILSLPENMYGFSGSDTVPQR